MSAPVYLSCSCPTHFRGTNSHSRLLLQQEILPLFFYQGIHCPFFISTTISHSLQSSRTLNATSLSKHFKPIPSSKGFPQPTCLPGATTSGLSGVPRCIQKVVDNMAGYCHVCHCIVSGKAQENSRYLDDPVMPQEEEEKKAAEAWCFF